MDEIEAFAVRIDGDPDVDALRLAIADLTGRLIAERRDNLGYWEKHCFANALGALALNIQRGIRDSTTGLLVSLNYLQAVLHASAACPRVATSASNRLFKSSNTAYCRC